MTQPRMTQQAVSAACGKTATFLGSGTFGDTWRVGEQAVKILCGQSCEPERLSREVAPLDATDHPGIVKLDGVRNLVIEGATYRTLWFEFIDGNDLKHFIDNGRKASATKLTLMLRQLLSGVQCLHEERFLHRDIKPANIVLRDSAIEKPVLVDFGLSKGLDSSSLTNYPQLLGTAMYASPEQLRGEPARKASDLWSVGVTVRETLIGHHAFFDGSEKNISDLFTAIASGPAPLPPKTPPELATVLDRLVNPKEHKRGSAKSNLALLET